MNNIRLCKGDIIVAIVMSLFAFALNEYIYYDSGLSYILNVFMIGIGLYLLYRRKLNFILYFSYIGFILNTRPREIHTIDIELRGNLDYYSINSQKLMLFSFSTMMLIFCFLLLFITNYKVWFIYIEKRLKLICLICFMAAISSMIFSLHVQQLNLSEATNTLRYLIFLMFGILVSYSYKHTYDVLTISENIIKQFLILLLIALLLSIYYIVSDFLNGEFKVRYITSSIFFSPLVYYFFLTKKISNFTKLCIPLMAFFIFIPITRGEQLIATIGFLMFVFTVFSKYHNNSTFQFLFPKILILVMVLGFSFVIYMVYLYLPETWNMLYMKVQLYLSGDLTYDQSSSVRTSEIERIINASSLYSIFETFIGKGFAGYYSLDYSMISFLNETDFDLESIFQNKFYTTHSFITFHILKFGVLGFLLSLYVYLSPIKLRQLFHSELNLLCYFCAPAILYISYFSPMYCFLMSFMLSVKANEKAHTKLDE